MSDLPVVTIKAGRDWQLRRGHPWLFSGGILRLPDCEPGGLVDLHDAAGGFVARGYYNPRTDIAVRVLTRRPGEAIDRAFFERRLRQAYELRRLSLDLDQTDVYRLVNAEGDFLPGLIVDHYAGTLVVQSHTAGIDCLLEPLTAALVEVIGPAAVLLRNDVAARLREGLTRQEPRLLYGELPAGLTVRENGLRFAIDPWQGQKTGFFTDQRDKRRALGRYAASLPPGVTMVNCFSYTAGFSVYAARNPGLRTINVDQSAAALEQARRNFELNRLDPASHAFEVEDVFRWLEAEAGRGGRHDIVILDPPAFAKTHKDKPRALPGYVRLNRLGLPLIRPGGLLLTCSCSGSVSLDEFIGCVRDAAAQSGRDLQVLETFENGPDHPFNLAVPESRYLKVLFCRAL